MARAIFLDSSPLGLVTHPRPEPYEEPKEWIAALTDAGARIVPPEIVDYEHRRKMLHIGSTTSVRYLDLLKQELTYISLTTAAMPRAAGLWAEARR